MVNKVEDVLYSDGVELGGSYPEVVENDSSVVILGLKLG